MMNGFTVLENITRMPNAVPPAVTAGSDRRHRGGLRALGRFIRALFPMPRWHSTISELNAMTDRELANIGLLRRDIPRVFDPDFAAAYGAGRRRRAVG